MVAPGLWNAKMIDLRSNPVLAYCDSLHERRIQKDIAAFRHANSRRRPMKKGTREAVQLLAIASSIGIAIVLATVIGLAAGYYLDLWLDTKPVLTLVFLLFGIIAGFKNIFVIMRRVQRLEKEADKE